MSREEIRVDGLAEPISHFTDAVRAGDLLFVSGIVARRRRGAARRRRRRRRAGAAGVREHARRARRGGLRVRGRRQGHGLPHGRRRPAADQPRAPGGVRRGSAGEHARRGLAAGRPGREGRGRGRGARPGDRRSWNAIITDDRAAPRAGRAARRADAARSRTCSTRPASARRTARGSTPTTCPSGHARRRRSASSTRAPSSSGRRNLPEFAWSVLGAERVVRDVPQPGASRARRPAARRAGSAAALAAGLCELALGTDTGCSIRLPVGRLRRSSG